ncbi:HNH endonuclease [Ancylobacter lacus]|uniref:HNH endonuclease n=1 Tax=Ancylobacter lacus TaxID=2579970 RepID=UPI001BCC3217|nr:HNH endonuclease [Ancylobacter lacus]MBS7538598.1 HNH endonuclease [Ancylobacter lacus]
MAPGVFIHRPDSIYSDDPAETYQFPRQYLRAAQGSVGDWIVYLEPRRVSNSRGYYAMAMVREIIPDPELSGMYVAVMVPGTYLDFPRPVPFRGPDGPVERGVLNEEGGMSGRKQAAVRALSSADFERIIGLAFDDAPSLLPRLGDAPLLAGFEETQTPFVFEEERSRVPRLTSRVERDRIFRRIVLEAYEERCAVTGLRLINGGGRAEVEAAHIRPVEANGPDAVTNGIALSGTVHWMFDRGLIGFDDDMKILISRQVNDAESIRSIINRNGYAHLPKRAAARPHPHFLDWHRENRFKL